MPNKEFKMFILKKCNEMEEATWATKLNQERFHEKNEKFNEVIETINKNKQKS